MADIVITHEPQVTVIQTSTGQGPPGPQGLPGPSYYEILDETAGVGGQAQFDTGVMDFSLFRQIEMRFTGRTDNNDIYDICKSVFNGDETVANYHHSAMWGNPTTSTGGGFACSWNGQRYYGGLNDGGVNPLGNDLGYATGATAQAGYMSRWRATIYDPGLALMPHTSESMTAYLDKKVGTTGNGPEVLAITGFWTPTSATAINRIMVHPAFGTEFLQGSRLVILGL